MENLKNYRFQYFTAKEVSPLGWTKHQLQTQLDGLSGHLCDFWPDISDCAWIGGSHDSWERTPYWLDGYIPLVYLLNDQKGIKTVEFYIKNIIKRQQEDGWIAPSNVDRSKYDVWGIFIVLKALLGYARIKNSPKTYHAIYKALKALNEHLDKYPLFDWAKFRWFEALLIIYPIYKKYKEEWLIELAHKLHDQGFDYYQYYLEDFPKKRCPTGVWNMHTHGVNNAMAVKCYGLYSLLTGDKEDYKKSDYMLKMLNKYHGVVSGTFNADECLAGKDPRQGSEVCLIVELMYSLEELTAISGKNKYIDQLERIAFNALPNGLTRDMWAHQYDSQVNAPFIKADETRIWTNNGPESNIYGLEPHYGCCTSNYHQGWPKFVLSAIAHRGNALYVNSYIPLSLSNRKYDLRIESSYPFNNNVVITVDSKVETHIYLNVPKYADALVVNGQSYKKDGYVKLPINKGKNIFKVEVQYQPRFEKSPYGYSLVDGNLVYALKVEEEFVQINKDIPLRELPHGDFEVHNKSKFNYIFSNLEIKKEIHTVDENLSPFVDGHYPVSYYMNCQEVKYKVIGNYIQLSKIVIGEKEKREFIPLGINKLHMGVLPLIKNK